MPLYYISAFGQDSISRKREPNRIQIIRNRPESGNRDQAARANRQHATGVERIQMGYSPTMRMMLADDDVVEDDLDRPRLEQSQERLGKEPDKGAGEYAPLPSPIRPNSAPTLPHAPHPPSPVPAPPHLI